MKDSSPNNNVKAHFLRTAACTTALRACGLAAVHENPEVSRFGCRQQMRAGSVGVPGGLKSEVHQKDPVRVLLLRWPCASFVEWGESNFAWVVAQVIEPASRQGYYFFGLAASLCRRKSFGKWSSKVKPDALISFHLLLNYLSLNFTRNAALRLRLAHF